MKQIPLTQGKFALVDDEDYDFLMQWKWYAEKKGTIFYAARSLSKKGGVKRRSIGMHRQILRVEDSTVFVDHKNANGLDNQRNNIRTCTSSQNMSNRCAPKHNTSGYKGVVKYANRSKFKAKIRVNGKDVYLGYFHSPKDAARAYNEAAVKYYGEFALLNII